MINKSINEIEMIQKALDDIDNDDENLELLEKAMEYFCGTHDKCQGYKDAIMYTVHDQYTNHSDEQDPNDLLELLTLLK